MNICGIPVRVDPLCEERTETQNRVHRRKRINKKWRKRYGVTVTATPCCYMIGNNEMLLVHPAIAEVWKKEAEEHRHSVKFSMFTDVVSCEDRGMGMFRNIGS